MTLPQSALNELLETIRSGDGTDVLREAMTLIFSESPRLRVPSNAKCDWAPR